MGFKIKEVRKSLKMSQEELAEKSGVSRGTIVALEAGTERVTTTKTLVALAAAMNVSIDQIFLPMMFNQLNARRTTWTPQFTSTCTWIPQELFAMAPFLTSARMTSCRSVMSSYWRIGVTTSQR